MIDRETQQRIKDAANIVEVVGDYVKLTRRGANYMGLCPFHNERTPSFSVSPHKNFCHCFSCKKGGSPVNFLMEKEGISYTEALLILAKKYNIPVEERQLSDEERARMSEREAMFIANEWAMNTFHDNLYNQEEGRDIGLAYLYSRGITDEAIKRFKLGYSIDKGDALLQKAKRDGIDIETLKKLGLVGTSQSGRDYDRFRGRVMFPIRNSSGKPVAFGGRALKGEPSKYINSPETMLYKKSNELYGIYEAKPEIIKNERVYLMEGYLDVIGSWQSGLKNAVASSGTALTESQIALIHRFTENVTLIYDGDSAGIKASIRGIDMLLAQKLHVKVLLLPEGEDPDSFARKHTPEEFQSYIQANQSDFIGYKLRVLLNNAGNDPHEITLAVRNVVNSIASIPDEIERIYYIKECARMVGIDEKTLSKQVARALINRPSGASGQIHNQDFNTSVNLPDLEKSVGNSGTPERVSQSPRKEQSHFIRHEEEIIKYCIRYAFLNVKFGEENPEFVIDYIAEEMEADGITFTSESFRKIFENLLELKEDFIVAFDRYRNEIEATLAEERNKFRDNLRMKGATLAKLKIEESNYLSAEEAQRTRLLKNFAVNYSVDFLISHEDDLIRKVSNRLVMERHTLSAIYSQRGKDSVPEEDKLFELVPRALSELRSEILNKKINDLKKELLEANMSKDQAKQDLLMQELNKMMTIRAHIAENLGERIISPR